MASIASTALGRSCERCVGGEASPQPDQLILFGEAGETALRRVNRRQGRYLGAPESHDPRGDPFGGAEGLVQQVEGERLGLCPAVGTALDCTRPDRPVEGEDELLTVAVLE